MAALYQQGDVQVTSAWANICGTNYAIRNIASVSVQTTRPSSALGGLLIIVGILLGLGSGCFMLASDVGVGSVVVLVLSIGMVALGAYLEATRKTYYHLVFQTNAGSVRAMTTVEANHAMATQAAILRAMAG